MSEDRANSIALILRRSWLEIQHSPVCLIMREVPTEVTCHPELHIIEFGCAEVSLVNFEGPAHEWSRGGASDIDGQTERSKRAGANESKLSELPSSFG
jgi:hypothetical protein